MYHPRNLTYIDTKNGHIFAGSMLVFRGVCVKLDELDAFEIEIIQILLEFLGPLHKV